MAAARPRKIRPLSTNPSAYDGTLQENIRRLQEYGQREQRRKRLYLTDCADGCPGHYCISRMQPDGRTIEHWSREGWCFASFGTLYRSKPEAKAAMAELRAFLKLSPAQQRMSQFNTPDCVTKVAPTGETTKGRQYCATLRLKTATLMAHADSPAIAMMLLGIKTGQWLLDGSTD